MPITWDTPGLDWDSGLDWDVDLGPSLGDVTPYLDRVTSEHRSKPNYILGLTALLQPLADIQANALLFDGQFDVDAAVGQQLDYVGQWVGVGRQLEVALSGVYFSLDITGLGFDQGSWFAPNDPVDGIVSLPDDAYRKLIYARIASNNWDGTIPGLYTIWNTLFSGTGFSIFVVDNEDMSMIFGIKGPPPDAVTLALITGGYLTVKPAGVRVNTVNLTGPIFGFDLENATVSGFDVGSWAVLS